MSVVAPRAFGHWNDAGRASKGAARGNHTMPIDAKYPSVPTDDPAQDR